MKNNIIQNNMILYETVLTHHVLCTFNFNLSNYNTISHSPKIRCLDSFHFSLHNKVQNAVNFNFYSQFSDFMFQMTCITMNFLSTNRESKRLISDRS